MKTWVILDLIAIGALLGVWLLWRLRAKRASAAAQSQTTLTTASPTPPAKPASTKHRDPATGRLVEPPEDPQGDGPEEAAAEATDAAAEPDSADSADGGVRPLERSRGLTPEVADDGAGDAAAENDADESDAVPELQVIVDVAHGRGESVLAVLRPLLGIVDAEAADATDESMTTDAGAEGEPEATDAAVELQQTGDVTGPLGADRLVFHTDDAPTLLTNVLCALRDCGYGIEMVVHHEVILHDVEAGVARIGLSQTGQSAEIPGGMPPNQISAAPLIV